MRRAAGNNHIYNIDQTFCPKMPDSATALRRISYWGLAWMLPLLLLTWLASGCGVAPVVDNSPTPTPLPTPVSTPTPPPPTPTPAAAKALIFTSNRALDGTDSTTTNQPSNIWGIN